VHFAVTLGLRKIDARNLEATCRLDFRPGQEEFVRSPARSIASAYVCEYGDRYEYLRLGIYDAEIMIGYAGLLCDPESDNDYWVGEILIDAPCQSSDYGRAAMREIIAHLRRNYPKCRTIQLTCHRDNRNAEALYLSLGFIKTGQLNPENGHPLYALTGAALGDISKV
jgi:RimJ/RimL family protein N-acetyltransferase